MQPQCLSSMDRELFLKTGPKEGGKKGLGLLKMRARSNSESGRGTLSSPEDSTVRHQSSLGESRMSGLNTPVLINRKSSLNSPIIANHVKNILSSLEGSVPQENGHYKGGRRSLDEGRVSLEEKRESERDSLISDAKAALSKRRGSLQPQRHIDEDDGGESSNLFSAPYFTTASVHREAQSPPFVSPKISALPEYDYTTCTLEDNAPVADTATGLDVTTTANPTLALKTCMPSPEPESSVNTSSDHTGQDTPSFVLSHSEGETSAPSIPAQIVNQGHRADGTNLKPKTFRTPSDIENENNLTQQEATPGENNSSDFCNIRHSSISEETEGAEMAVDEQSQWAGIIP